MLEQRSLKHTAYVVLLNTVARWPRIFSQITQNRPPKKIFLGRKKNWWPENSRFLPKSGRKEAEKYFIEMNRFATKG
jgi:hypothetical protein